METYLVKTVFGILKSQSVFWILAILYSPSKVRQIAPVRRRQIVAWRWCLDLWACFIVTRISFSEQSTKTMHVQINDAISQCTFLVNIPAEGNNVRSTYIIYTGILFYESLSTVWFWG